MWQALPQPAQDVEHSFQSLVMAQYVAYHVFFDIYLFSTLFWVFGYGSTRVILCRRRTLCISSPIESSVYIWTGVT